MFWLWLHGIFHHCAHSRQAWKRLHHLVLRSQYPSPGSISKYEDPLLQKGVGAMDWGSMNHLSCGEWFPKGSITTVQTIHNQTQAHQACVHQSKENALVHQFQPVSPGSGQPWDSHKIVCPTSLSNFSLFKFQIEKGCLIFLSGVIFPAYKNYSVMLLSCISDTVLFWWKIA